MAAVLEQCVDGTTFVRATAGRVGPGVDPDLLVVAHSGEERQALYLQDPMQHNVAVVLRYDIVDAVVLPTGGAVDVIAVLTAEGVELMRTPLAGSLPETFASLPGEWSGVQSLWTGGDAAGQPLLFGADASGTRLLRGRFVAGAWQQLPALSLPTAGAKVMTMDYDGVGEVELVLQLGHLVVVLPFDGGTPLLWLSMVSPDGAPTPEPLVTVARGDAASPYRRDLLLAVGVYFGHNMLLAHNAGASAFVPIGDGWSFRSIAALRADAHGLGGVGIGDQDAMVHVVRRVDGPGLVTVPAASDRYVLVRGLDRPSGALSCLCAGDFDGDGDGDVVALQSEGRILHVVAGADSATTRCAATVAVTNSASDCVDLQLTVPVVPAVPLAAGESLEFELVGWMQWSSSSPRESQAAFVARVPAGPLVATSLTLFAPAGTNLDEDWSLEVRCRAVVVGPGYERKLAPTLTHFAVDADVILESLMLRIATLSGTAGLPLGGTSGDGNTTGGLGRPGAQPRRP